ncbi:hypothetical protein OS493_023506 [Desmophyllum pertusum]|uniref:Uncharacterized protein n=1 Tax=Desmophyllum pertusum TaxID=174260 RepID=A0A9X0D1Y0_9CNID|nr:hypothetical protein OS493_023506 [Desmophyllum pertusum]
MEVINYSMAKLMLGSHCVLQGIKSLDGFGERFSDLAFIVTTKWKLLLLILTIMYGIFRLLQKTCEEVKPSQDSFLLARLFSMIKCACLSGDRSLITYMLNKGADVNSNTTCKDSALHLASFCCGTQNVKNGLGVITCLFEAGCNINSKNWLGNTPLSIAASSGNCDLVRHLMSLGGDKSICNNDGIYAMDFAINAGHLDAANLLAIDVPNPHVWDIVDPHTPPRVKLGLQSPCKQHLCVSSFRRRRMDFSTLVK